MKAELLKEVQASPKAEDEQIIERDGKRYWPEGSVVEGPRSFRLVQLGVAVPGDEECREKCDMTDDQMKLAQEHQELVSKGIHPDDYQRYRDGEILGYDEAGNDIPGPNWKDEDEDGD